MIFITDEGYYGIKALVKEYEDGTVHGYLLLKEDYVDFVAPDLNHAEEEIKKAIDEYLTYCLYVGKEPDKKEV